MGKLLEVEMDIREKEKVAVAMEELELEKGEYMLVEQNQVQRRDRGPSVYYKVMLSLAFLVFLAHNTFCRARPVTLVRLSVEGVPRFVLDYAPIIYLDTAEAYFPSDIGAQISNTHPSINNTAIENPPSLTVSNISMLNQYGNNGTNVYLTSNVDVTLSPSWLTGIVPSSSTGKTHNAISAAIIINSKPSNITDAFYMYFYAYNQGNTVLGRELGDHIGDWEQNMIRFQDGIPQAMWFSQHSNGEAFTYDAMEKYPKNGKRPVSYSARGSHANYATVGKHDHTIPDLNLPNGLIVDVTSKGMLWDPTLNSYFYTYNSNSNTTNSSKFKGINGSPIAAMDFNGRWGDEQYPKDDPRQPDPFFGFVKYVSGPTGPGDKYLEREKVCPDNGIYCLIRDKLGP